MSSGEKQGRSVVRIVALCALALILIAMAIVGAGAGLLYLARQDDDLAARLEDVPILSQLLPEPVDETEELCELDNQRTLLSLKRSELDTRERELLDREQAVAASWSEVTELAATLDAEIEEITVLRERLEGRSADIERLIEVYGVMKPAAVAGIVSELDDALAVVILAGLDQRQTARVMEELDRELAAKYTRLLGSNDSVKGGDGQ